MICASSPALYLKGHTICSHAWKCMDSGTRNRLIYEHSVLLQLRDLCEGLYLIQIALMLIIRTLCLFCQLVVAEADVCRLLLCG